MKVCVAAIFGQVSFVKHIFDLNGTNLVKSRLNNHLKHIFLIKCKATTKQPISDFWCAGIHRICVKSWLNAQCNIWWVYNGERTVFYTCGAVKHTFVWFFVCDHFSTERISFPALHQYVRYWSKAVLQVREKTNVCVNSMYSTVKCI